MFKRDMGTDRVYRLGRNKFRAEDLSAIVLRSLRADAEAHLDEDIGMVVISVPAYFNEMQRKAVRNAGAIAGFDVARLINEPSAAALAYGLQDRDAESIFLVFDLGGGTFDVSILEMFEGVMEVRATSGDAFLGGEDFTRILSDKMAKIADIDPVSLSLDEKAALLTLAEKTKLALSTKHEVRFAGVVGQREIKGTMSRSDVDQIGSTLLRRMQRPVDRALHDARLAADEIERVVLVGGATRMPMIRSIIAKQFHKLPEAGLDPDQVVALGAAVQAALVARDAGLEDVVMTDVSSFTLGMEIVREVGGSVVPGFYLPVIERNTTVPVSREKSVHTVHKGQRKVRISVYQGEALRVQDNIFLGEFDIKVPRNWKQTEALAVRFTYDVSGLLQVEARSYSSGKIESMVIRSLAGELSDSEIESRLQRLECLKVHPRDESENRALMARLEQCYAMALGHEREHLQDLLTELEALIERQDRNLLSDFRDQLGAYLDAFEDGYVS
jgi:molecular chaperone HscC